MRELPETDIDARVKRLLAGTRYGRYRADALTRELEEIVLPAGQAGHSEVRASGAGRRRHGRIDWLGEIEGARAALVGEIKQSDWDRMAPGRVRPNARRHGRQLWRYLDSPEVATVGQAWVQLFVEYPRRPITAGRAQEIEDVLAEYGVTVSWVES